MSTPAAKRRRLEAATAALRKPFTSPVINRAKTDGGAASSTPTKTSRPASLRSALSREQPAQARDDDDKANATTPLSSSHQPQSQAAPQRKHKAPHATASEPSPTDQDENSLLSLVVAHETELNETLDHLEQQLESARQAARTERQSESQMPGGPADQELRDLVGKWRAAGRMAAEELFELAKDRVSREGGSRAWGAMQRRQRDFYGDLDRERPVRESGSDDAEGYEEAETGLLEAEEDGREDAAEPEFDMLAMLRSLNIDPALLGYNAEEGGWVG
ncbi:hypothetical protein NKR23_g11063 [Pleurostoma richardsiae]|uniref:Swi5-dependent recombination DNA repair protein 1 n=1 Tax=Pleurostoma richardsiae TaxID=41990 RepID=A0AA38RB68_9PEZI|nr:hypothetical protein NKR23_g11063 [Pleurostoma richardsiae]